jgi:hypothetical protein
VYLFFDLLISVLNFGAGFCWSILFFVLHCDLQVGICGDIGWREQEVDAAQSEELGRHCCCV